MYVDQIINGITGTRPVKNKPKYTKPEDNATPRKPGAPPNREDNNKTIKPRPRRAQERHLQTQKEN
jgi:hypothetical protein